MRVLVSAAAAFAFAVGGTVLGAVPAHAATGEVVVFTTEFEELTRYPDPPSGVCHSLPATAHVLVNLTDSDVSMHAGPACLSPGLVVAPDHGWHAPPSGMFSFSVS
ncbi:hypothetical protein A6A08_16070 [Nocardiopsis sp. TSRI0078]|uniref:hypothetical protein n=1 Tax=unclassified Nocardiopsis TaxID=2649073 RepID=UPI000938BA7C|nr:hypothetical protein [Nocardiopsis sp. TSRI0078]OKI12965.1 hypothetical protein A6A08_16070 [Nocardiopsis sp. TSRI0078]